MPQYIESERVELKEKYTDTLAREVVSFLNSYGGTIYIGVADDGTVLGVVNPDEVLRKVSDCITDQIEPSPQGEIRCEIILENGRMIVAVNVNKGLKPLYCIKKYGFSSKGCPVRIGSTCKDMFAEEIQFRYRTQFKHEDFMLMAPARYAPLEFNMMKILLTSQGFHVNDHSFEANFHLKREDGSYNLLAELLADQNMLPLIFVKFRGRDKTTISQRSDYGGQSLLLAYQKMKARLAAENICKTDTTVRPRVDKFLYDADAVNEVLVNMLVHNDWTISEPLVSFFTDRIEFTSHGGLPHGMTEEEFFKGISQPRNAGLMRVFLSLGLVEHTGHGVPLVVEKYGREVFDIRPSYITVNIPFDKDVLASGSYDDTSTVAYGLRDAASDAYGSHFQEVYARSPLSKKEEAVLMELIRNPKATYTELAEHTGISRRTVSRAIARLVEMSYLERIGNNKAGFWKINR